MEQPGGQEAWVLMAKESILVVDDEEDILELVEYNLAKDGYRISCAATGEAALKSAKGQLPDLIVLDLMLPGLDGLEICKRLKGDPKTKHIPIVMLTAKGEEADIVTGLELGADDYITKPFSPRVLAARIKTVLRRKSAEPDDDRAVVKVHDMLIHPGRHEVLVQGNPIDLTHTEFRILQLLARRPGWVFTRYQIINGVQGDDIAVTDRSVDVHIVSLRRKLGTAGEYIETIRGVGYRFKEQA
jgi:two-component system, OmpR family, alkaline phosphatase synthesis response regulator PhoP